MELVRGDRVQAGRRLVEKEQVGIVHERTGERQSLLHASAESAHAILGAVGDAEFGEQRVDTRAGVGSGDIVHLGECLERLARR